MNIFQKLELIKRNTVELIRESELEELLKKKKQPVVYCGYEPSGPLHLGHLTTLTKLMDFEKAGFKVIILLSDTHALVNRKGSEKEIAKQIDIWKRAIKAIGLNAKFVVGSSFQFKKEYWQDIIQMAINTSVKRGMRSMQELARDFENATISQMLYPLMQAEDIKFLDVDVAYGAMEQRKVHMIARERLPKIGCKAPIILHTGMIAALSGKGKMSSSTADSLISVIDSNKAIEKKVAKAFCPAKQIADNPILQIIELIIFPRVKSFVIKRDKKFGGDLEFTDFSKLKQAYKEGLHPMDLKNAVSKELEKIIKPIRNKF